MTVKKFLTIVKPGMALILRGCPGSGKSSIIEKVKGQLGPYQQLFTASADHHRMVNGVYTFDAAKNGQAHAGCMRDFIRAAQPVNAGLGRCTEYHVIACDNTNIEIEEMAPYVSVASAFGWEPIIVDVETDPHVAAARNVHGVPRDRVIYMARRTEHITLPKRWKQVTITQE